MIKHGINTDNETLFAHCALDHKARYELLLENHAELLQALEAFTPDLWRKDRTKDYFRQKRLIVRRLFNWLASAHAFSDATRRLLKDERFDQNDQKRYCDVLESDAAVFLDELRHFSVHQLLPYVAGYREDSYSSSGGVNSRASIELPQQVLIAMFESRAKREKGAQKAIRYAQGKSDLIGLSDEVSAFETIISEYTRDLRKRTEQVSTRAQEFFSDDDNPEPLGMSVAARKRIENGDA